MKLLLRVLGQKREFWYMLEGDFGGMEPGIG